MSYLGATIGSGGFSRGRGLEGVAGACLGRGRQEKWDSGILGGGLGA